MTREEQLVHIEKFVTQMALLLQSKGDDYADNADRLSNFKLVGGLTNQTAAQAAFFLICVKVARLSELLYGKEPKHESVQDTLLDLANYAVLCAECLEDEALTNVGETV